MSRCCCFSPTLTARRPADDCRARARQGDQSRQPLQGDRSGSFVTRPPVAAGRGRRQLAQQPDQGRVVVCRQRGRNRVPNGRDACSRVCVCGHPAGGQRQRSVRTIHHELAIAQLIHSTLGSSEIVKRVKDLSLGPRSTCQRFQHLPLLSGDGQPTERILERLPSPRQEQDRRPRTGAQWRVASPLEVTPVW